MELMKLTIELGTNLEKAAAEKEQLRQQISDVDQAVSQILGEMQKTAANITHIKCAHCILPCFLLEPLSLEVIHFGCTEKNPLQLRV